jgi:hypothetical protein
MDAGPVRGFAKALSLPHRSCQFGDAEGDDAEAAASSILAHQT